MPYDVPSTSVVFWAPSKNTDLSMLPGVGSSAPMPANSPIHVVPTIATSGVLLAVIAVVNLSWAASQGIAVTCTLTPGLADSNSLTSSGRFWPSAPMAQTLMVPVAAPELTALPVWAAPLPASWRPQADTVRANRATLATVVAVVRLIGLSLSGWGMGGGLRGEGRPGAARRRRAAARGAQDDLGRQDLRVLACGAAGEEVCQPVGGEGAELLHRLAHRRQRRADVAGGHDVVPAGDGDVPRDVDPAVDQAAHGGPGQLVAAADEALGRQPPREEPLGHPPPAAQAAHGGQGQLVVAADEAVGRQPAGEEPFGDPRAGLLARLDRHRRCRLEAEGPVRGDESLVALEQVDGGLDVAHEEEPAA